MIHSSSCTNQNHNYFRNGGLSSRRSFVASKALANLMKNSVSDFSGTSKFFLFARHRDVMPKISTKKRVACAFLRLEHSFAVQSV